MRSVLSDATEHYAMTLEDFEKELADSKRILEQADGGNSHEPSRKRHKRHHSHHHNHRYEEEDRRRHRHKRSKHTQPINASHSTGRSDAQDDEGHEIDRAEKKATVVKEKVNGHVEELKRDSWMERPLALDIDTIQKSVGTPSDRVVRKTLAESSGLKEHEGDLNKDFSQNHGEALIEAAQGILEHEVDYTFGDAGAQWRMTRLRGVYRQAEETGRPVEEMAIEQYGTLERFDDAREEQIEMDRRETYGEGYAGKEKPSGELFAERKLVMGAQNGRGAFADERNNLDKSQVNIVGESSPPETNLQLDRTALNKLKAQMMKAKLRGSATAEALEAEYANAIESLPPDPEPRSVVLSTMENRMLASGRKGEVKVMNNKRGRERGLVEENEDMSIEDMIREERRTKNQAGGEGLRLAERIAKDSKFDNDLDYIDENAAKLAKRVHKSEINLKSSAISDFQKMSRVLDNCPLCYHEDSGRPPIAPVVSLATRSYLTLPTEPEISDGGACIIPIQHRGNLLECDDDEWEEIRNFMKSLTRMYHDQGRHVIFYENAASPQRKKHAGMEVVPLPYSLGDIAPAFFKEAILTSDEEWTQHKKIIDTLAKARQGLGKAAFRRTLVKEMPYFHVWFELDGGLGHIVEDANRWPKGDLFAREILGGMLDKGPDVIKRQGKWTKGSDLRVDNFQRRWRKFDWTRILTDS